MQLQAESAQLRELIMMENEYPSLRQPSAGDLDDTDGDSELFPSLLELSMGGGEDSESLGSNREDLMTMVVHSDEQGDYGLTLRHFTVLAAIPVSLAEGRVGGIAYTAPCMRVECPVLSPVIYILYKMIVLIFY